MRTCRPAVSRRFSLSKVGLFGSALALAVSAASAESAYVRVNQIGYEAGASRSRAYLMSTVPETDATFKVTDTEGKVAYRGKNRGAVGHMGA